MMGNVMHIVRDETQLYSLCCRPVFSHLSTLATSVLAKDLRRDGINASQTVHGKRLCRNCMNTRQARELGIVPTPRRKTKRIKYNVTFYREIRHMTAKAYLFRDSTGFFWVPKRACEMLWEMGAVKIQDWYKKKYISIKNIY